MNIDACDPTCLPVGEGSAADDPPPPLEERPSVLVVSPHDEDHVTLSRVFARAAWQIHRSDDLEGAVVCLRQNPISVVLCDCFFERHSWKDLLEQLWQHPNPPALIVACDKADGRLWAEVLNLGGYDVLAKPFSLPEVTWVVVGAHRQWRLRAGIASE